MRALIKARAGKLLEVLQSHRAQIVTQLRTKGLHRLAMLDVGKINEEHCRSLI